MMVPFIDLFLSILIARNHDSMKDEIVQTLSKLMLCNVDMFKREYIPHFMTKFCGSISPLDRSRILEKIGMIEESTEANDIIVALTKDLLYFQ
ncbi:hypothetical protein HDU83_007152 [Entophlyctis luteolus]|nr:hypothetical protein HDU83_007152 [Entophlyctis luteolus]